MGNQQSNHQNEKSESTLLKAWSTQDQTCLKDTFDRIQNKDSSITTEEFIKAVNASLLPCIDRNIATSISEYIGILDGMKNKKITWKDFLEAANKLLGTDDQTSLDALYTIFEGSHNSLETFVHHTINSGIPIWFEGTGVIKANDSIWQSLDDDQQVAAQQLTQYVLYASYLEKERKRQQQQEDMFDFDTTDKSDTTKKADKETNTWIDKVKSSPSQVSKAEFINWAQSTPTWTLLLELIFEEFFMGSKKDDNSVTSHQRRTKHKLAPLIQRPLTKLVGKKKFSRLLTPYDYFLLSQYLPSNALSWSDYEKTENRAIEDLSHRLIFSSQRDGTSWQVFVNRIVSQGATIVVFKAKDGSLFGGYADAAWEQTTDWTGLANNFLFRLRSASNDDTAMGVWEGHNGVNDHFQYLCWGTKSLPNGIGMGGQFDYAGLWLNSDFLNGHTRGGPLCTTYMSPPLASKDTFLLEEAEVWLVRPLPQEDEEAKGSALDRAEDMEFLEMAGKKLYSKDLGKPENAADEEEEEDDDDDV